MGMQSYTRVIADGAESRIPATGNFIFLEASTAELLITARSDRNRSNGNVLASRAPLREGRKLRTAPDVYDEIVVRNESGASVTCTVIAGFGDFDAPLSAVEISTPNTITAAANVTADAAGLQLLPANPDRVIAWVGVDVAAANEAILAESAAIAAAGRGLQLSPGISYPIASTAALFVARSGAADVTVRVLETSNT